MDCVLQPKVARNELPWERHARKSNPNGVVTCDVPNAATPLGCDFLLTITQGGSFLATLGFESESRWDSQPACSPPGNWDPYSFKNSPKIELQLVRSNTKINP